jgi:hypothetical protein
MARYVDAIDLELPLERLAVRGLRERTRSAGPALGAP